MKRIAVLGFSVLCYLLFFGAFLYLVAFVSDLYVPKTVSTGAPPWTGPALLVDLGLVALFGLQHSVMARGSFKRAMTKLVIPELNRSIFVLAAAVVLVAMFVLWQPVPTVLWETHGTAAEALLVGEGVGWLMVLVSTFLIDHFELFGLRQAWAYFRGKEFQPPVMKTPGFYRYVRHPIYLGFFIAFWSAPIMTAGRMIFVAAMSSYTLLGIRFEERDLIRHFGEAYRTYRQRVGMLFPRLARGEPVEEPRLGRAATAHRGSDDA